MTRILWTVLSSLFLTLLPSVVFADAPCAEALVKSSYDFHSSKDHRLAVLVTRGMWEEQHKQAGASGEIYGIPIGGNYDDFHGRAEQYLRSVHQSDIDALNVAWTGLDPNAVTVYEACLELYAAQSDKPFLGVVAADNRFITILVGWHNLPVGTTLATWQPQKVIRNLPTHISLGFHKYAIARPTQRTNLSWNSKFDSSQTIVLEPLPTTAAVERGNISVNCGTFVSGAIARAGAPGQANAQMPRNDVPEDTPFPIPFNDYTVGTNANRTYGGVALHADCKKRDATISHASETVDLVSHAILDNPEGWSHAHWGPEWYTDLDLPSNGGKSSYNLTLTLNDDITHKSQPNLTLSGCTGSVGRQQLSFDSGAKTTTSIQLAPGNYTLDIKCVRAGDMRVYFDETITLILDIVRSNGDTPGTNPRGSR